jgi:hypothetical protein
MKVKYSLLPLTVLGITVANGTTVLTENFTYSDGSIVGAAGPPWVTHSGTTGQANVASGALIPFRFQKCRK